MDIDGQNLFNAAFAIIAMLGGWVLNLIFQQQRDTAKRVAHIEILVAGEYVKREEVNVAISKLEAKIDKIASAVDAGFDKMHDKLNSKVDK